MLNRILTTVLIAAALFTSQSQIAGAFELDPQIVLGKAHFEKRSTVVPMAVCEGERCPKPTPYWSLVLVDRGAQYEVNQMFAFGSHKCPGEIEIAGTRVKQGVRVAIEGRVQALGNDYHLVSDVNRATVLPSIYTAAESENFLPNAYGWKCQTPEARVPMQVDILYNGADSMGDRYEIHVSRIRDNAARSPIASAPDAIQQIEEDRIIFRGKADESILQVLIARTEDRPANLPAFLTISKNDPGAFIVYDLRCNRTRF